MAHLTKKNDFVELEFIGRVKNGEIFDTNIKEEAKKINLEIDTKPLVICIGQGMLVKGFDKELESKEIGKKYKIELNENDAFGKRNSQLVKIVPLKVFRDKDFSPVPGIMINIDNMLAKIVTVSGGRVIVDFNNPMAGKEIEYEFTIKKLILDESEKINALQDFFFRHRFTFELKDNKIIFQKEAEPILKLLSAKFKEILGKEIEAEQAKKQEEKKIALNSI